MDVGTPGHHHTTAGDGGNHKHAASVKTVNGDGTVDAWVFGPTGNTPHTNLPCVDAGGTPPSGATEWFQAV